MLIPKDENVLSITGSFRLEKTLRIIEAAVNTTRPSAQTPFMALLYEKEFKFREYYQSHDCNLYHYNL